MRGLKEAMKTTIPEVSQVTCDVCKTDCGCGRGKKEAKLTIKRHALDFVGDPAADGTVTMDLCDECESRIASMINELITHHNS